MEAVQNDVSGIATKSDLSEWVGPPGQTQQLAVTNLRNMEQPVETDVLEWTDRLISLDELELNDIYGYSVSPLALSKIVTSPFYYLKDIPWFRRAADLYYGFVYDSIEVRITMTDPKNLMGGVFTGWFPYYDYYDEPSSWTSSQLDDPQLRLNLINGPYTWLNLFGMSEDVLYTIPWTFKYPFYRTNWMNDPDEPTQDQRHVPGTPIMWLWMFASQFVTSITNPSKVRMFVKFNNLRFVGPNSQELSELEAHSGVEAVGLASAIQAASTAAGINALASDVADMFSTDKLDIDEIADQSTFDRPQAVQQAYLGDTTSSSFPSTTPIFSPLVTQAPFPIPTVHEILSRPQFIGVFTQPTDFCNDPLKPIFNSAGPFCTYMRWFGMLNRYWRGTLNLHIVVPGHPLVQQQMSAFVRYDGYVDVPNARSQTNVLHSSTFAGNKQVTIPIPFLTIRDYIPVQDRNPSGQVDALYGTYTSVVNVATTVVSTMLTTNPTPVYLAFISAGADFAFYQPYPCGIYNAEDLPPETELEAQVFLPTDSTKEVVRTRSTITSDPGTLVQLKSVYDYMKIWSRCVPFFDYDNDGDEEPIPDPQVGFSSASWYTPVDRSRDPDVNNSWYFTLDYIAYFASMFLYFRGSLAYKIVLSAREDQYSFVSLGDPQPIQRQPTHVPFPYDPMQLPPNSNFASGTVATPVGLQPLLELSVPYRGTNVWGYCFAQAPTRGKAKFDDQTNASVYHNLELQDPDTDELKDAMFRKIGSDFALAVETILPPVYMWAARGFDWVT